MQRPSALLPPRAELGGKVSVATPGDDGHLQLDIPATAASASSLPPGNDNLLHAKIGHLGNTPSHSGQAVMAVGHLASTPNHASADSTPSTTTTVVTPLTAQQAVKLYADRLASWEVQEIRQHYAVAPIYFLGSKRTGVSHRGQFLNAQSSEYPKSLFETPQGDYKPVVGDHLGYRYEILGRLGSGTFGQVVKAFGGSTVIAVGGCLEHSMKMGS